MARIRLPRRSRKNIQQTTQKPMRPSSPFPTTVQRTRRIDPAKTIEKTIQRSTKKRETTDQEIQSDRLDDSSRYLRYSAGSSIGSTYSPHRDRISSLRYSASPLNSSGSAKSSSVGEGKQIHSIPEAVSPARTNGSVSSAKSSEALSPPRTNGSVSSAKSTELLSPPRSNGSVNTSKSPEAVSPPRINGSSSSLKSTKSKLSPPKVIRLNSRQSSVENLVNKPPAPPNKADSPTKTCSSSSGSSAVKWPNKDFRKSSLNVGPTDRPRKSRTPSSGGESEDLPNGSSLERSPSAGSEGSLASAGSSKKSNKLSNGKMSGATSKPKSHKSCSETTTTTGNSSSATASASDSEQRVKTVKKQAKKKGGAGKVAVATATAHNKPNSTTESPPAVADVVPATQTRLKKLSAVSNFFASRQQDANNEPIFLESSESSGEPEALSLPVISGMSKISGISLNTDLRTNEPRTTPSSEAKPSPPTNSQSSSTRCPRESTTGTGTRLPTTTSISTISTTQETSLTTTASLTTSEQDDPSWWQDTSLQINTASALDQNNRGEMPPYRLRHIDSGEEQAWWLRQDEQGDEDDTLAEETLNPLDDDAAQEPSKGTWWSQEEQDSSSQVKLMPRSRLSPEKDAWWLQEEEEQAEEPPKENVNDVNNNSEPHVEVTLKLPSNGSQRSSKASASKSGGSSKSNGSNPWWLSGPARKMFNVQRVESGERAWWQEEPEEPPQEEKESEPPPVKPPTPPPRIIRHWESGERAWWLQEDSAQPADEDVEQPVSQQDSRDEVDRRLAAPPPHTLASQELSSSFNFNASSERPPPLGQCASPVRCPSPYDNIPRSQVQEAPPPPMPMPTPTLTPLQPRFSPQTRRAGEKLFISRHQNIDELLGGACRPLSPLFYGNTHPAEAELTPLASKNMFLLEEVTPDQVRIHDSTAQLPVIQRMQRDVEWLENGSSFYEQPKHQQQQQQQQHISSRAGVFGPPTSSMSVCDKCLSRVFKSKSKSKSDLKSNSGGKQSPLESRCEQQLCGDTRGREENYGYRPETTQEPR
ncbi:serine-rich adhesin for platelets-like [Drosophila gunungcola]|uniref:serine-rich adhesin for platelets-like n=1 Tax=Drosophila gunungcola TaxID=103775 RepID=UPI0022E69394|nr:serine-rich adhesin for platelets-like [Drosophila gunungcola]